MKVVYKCDYCSKIGTKKQIKEHEPNCTENYDRKSCYTCIHRKLKFDNERWSYECKADKEIPEGKLFEFCKLYKREETSDNQFGSLLGSLF